MINEQVVHGAITICGMFVLAEYEIRRQWPKEKVAGLSQFVERNWPRMIFTAILAPGLFKQFGGLASLVGG